jgi:hypothetical protein
MSYRVLIFMVILLVCPFAAYGYIDPGTGSAVFGAIGYIIAAAGAFFVIALKPFKMLYRRIFKKDGIQKAAGKEQENN